MEAQLKKYGIVTSDQKKRYINYLDNLPNSEWVDFLTLPESKREQMLLNFEIGSEQIQNQTAPQIITQSKQFTNFTNLEDEKQENSHHSDFSDDIQNSSTFSFQALQNSILPADYLLEYIDQFFFKQIVEECAFFLMDYGVLDENLDQPDNYLIVRVSSLIKPVATLYDDFPILKPLSLIQQYNYLSQHIPNPLSKFETALIQPNPNKVINLSLLYSVRLSLNKRIMPSQLFTVQSLNFQQSSIYSIKNLTYNEQYIKISTIQEETEKHFALRGFSEQRSANLDENLRMLKFRKYYFQQNSDMVKVSQLEQEITFNENKLKSQIEEKQTQEIRFLASNQTDLIDLECETEIQELLKNQKCMEQEQIIKEITLFNLKIGQIVEFKETGEVEMNNQVIGMKNSEYHRCDRLNSGKQFAGYDWYGKEKIIFKFV